MCVEFILSNLVFIVAIVGSLLGSFKATLEKDTPVPRVVKCFNTAIGVFCGMNVSHVFHQELELGYIGLIALISAMIGSNVLDVISELAPGIAKNLIKRRFK